MSVQATNIHRFFAENTVICAPLTQIKGVVRPHIKKKKKKVAQKFAHSKEMTYLCIVILKTIFLP